jgi:hypothetical membrane protein
MIMKCWRNPGLLLFLGSVQALFMIHIAEFLYPGYSVSQNFISDLGVGPEPSRSLFTITIIAFGVLVVFCVYMMDASVMPLSVRGLTALTGIGAIGVGIFNENFGTIHLIFAGLAFGIGNLAAVISSRFVKGPLSPIFAALGIIGLAALTLQSTKTFMGLGVGGMERMIFYPLVFWALASGVYLMYLNQGKDVPA